jgi:hypothetical protein
MYKYSMNIVVVPTASDVRKIEPTFSLLLMLFSTTTIFILYLYIKKSLEKILPVLKL